VKLPSAYSQLDSLDGVFGTWGKLMRIVQSHLSLDWVIVIYVLKGFPSIVLKILVSSSKDLTNLKLKLTLLFLL